MKEQQNLNVSIVGASGYTGIELVRILLHHPNVSIKQIIANNNSGKYLNEIYPHFKNEKTLKLISLKEAKWDNTDVIFLCLPHTASQKIIRELPSNIKIIDLSADFRIKDKNLYSKWYGEEHLAPEFISKASYGLPELFKEEIKDSDIIACPGCFPTGAILPLFPLLQQNIIEAENIIIDSKTGVSGAGRNLKQNLLFCEMNENIYPYNICNHRHIAEIEQSLYIASKIKAEINFVPQIIPINRGILSTIYTYMKKDQNIDDLHKTLKNFYKDSFFIKVMDQGYTPNILEVQHTNYCHISVHQGRSSNLAVITSVIDNLGKGAAGQAIQNMNIIFNLKENSGLNNTPAFP